jgi:peptidoglycan/LPS O-acetylase OafA/YrhL
MQPEGRRAAANYRPDIDGLRAIAILAVVFYHAGFPGFSGGYVGVDVFFVISGFLITRLLFDEASSTGTVGLGAFYARRVRRLMPAALIVVAATLLLGAFFMPPGRDGAFALARSAISVAFFVSNFFFFSVTGGYFGAPSFNLPLLHTWSLAVEEQYYLVWPLLMLLVFRLAKDPRANAAMRTRVLWILGSLLLASLALSVITTPDHPNFAFYLLPTRVWEFAIGGMAGMAGAAFYERVRAIAQPLALLGLAMILYSIVALSHATPFPGSAAIWPVFGTAILIVGMTANQRGVVSRLLATKPMVYIGLISYSFYLWHWPLLSFYRIYNLGVQDLAANAVLVVLAMLLAWLGYVFVENPIRLRRPWVFGEIRSTLLAGGGISLVTVSMAGMLMGWHAYQRSSGEDAPAWAALDDQSPYMHDCSLDGKRPVGALPREACIHGPDPQHPRVVLWGDSHADHIMPMLMDAYSQVAVYQLTMPGCVPAIGYESKVPFSPKYCADFNLRVLKEIEELKAGGLEGVVISARWPSYFMHQSPSLAEQIPGLLPLAEDQLAVARLEMQSAFDSTLQMLERIGVRVIVVAPTPELVYPAPQCVALRGEDHCNVARSVNEAWLGDATTALAEVVERHPNAHLAQLMDFFCDADSCSATEDGTILYVDDDHITATTARDLGRFLSHDLAWLPGRQDGAAEVEQ